MQNKALHIVAFTLLAIGGLNWGLLGLFNFNLVEGVLSFVPGLPRIVYILVGLSAATLLVTHRSECRLCGAPASHTGPSSPSTAA